VTTTAPPPRLERRLGSALGWLYLTQYSGKLLVFLSVAILARLLSPEDFALVAIALALIVFVDSLEVGVGSALIYLDRRESDSNASTAFTLHLLSAIVAAAAFAVAAPWIASWYDDERLRWIITLLALNLVIRALGQTHENLLRRDLNFRARLWPELGNGVTKGVGSVVLALGGAGVWALVVGQLAGGAVRTVLLWIKVPFRPHFDIGRGGRAKRLLGYGLPLMLGAVIESVAINADYLVIGSMLGVTALGFYVVAYRIPQLIFDDALGQIHHALFPYYSRSREHGADTGGRYFSTIRLVSLVTVPFVVPLAVLAEPAIRLVFGPQWNESAAILPGLAIGAAVLAIGGVVGDLFKARGRQHVIPLMGLAYLVLWIPALLVIAPYGTVAVAWGTAVMATLWSLGVWACAHRILGTGLRFHLAAVGPALAAAAVGTVVAVACLIALPAQLALFVGTGLVVAVWAVMAWYLSPEARGLVRAVRRRPKAEVTP
jgi:lipopolysaccharide exporter